MGRLLNEQVFLPLSTRLARRLLHLCAVAGVEEGCALALSQAELAEFVGATREAVSKILSAWRKSGVIAAGRGGLTIRDRAALQALADPEAI